MPNAQWVVRAFNNLFPRIPGELTGNRNESYIVVEDPRHFVDEPRTQSDLIFTGALGEGHFFHLMEADVRVMRLAFENPNVCSVVIRRTRDASRAPPSLICISKSSDRPSRFPQCWPRRVPNARIRISGTRSSR